MPPLPWSGELHPISCGKRALPLMIDRHSLKASRVIADAPPVLALDGNAILFAVHCGYFDILPGFKAQNLAGPAIADKIARLVLRRPCAVCSGHLLPRFQHPQLVFSGLKLSAFL